MLDGLKYVVQNCIKSVTLIDQRGEDVFREYPATRTPVVGYMWERKILSDS